MKNINDIAPYPLVFIKWIDSYGCGNDWSALEDITAAPHYCYSVGWLVQTSDEVSVVVPHYSPENEGINLTENGWGGITIPKVSIVWQTTLTRRSPSEGEFEVKYEGYPRL